MPPIPRVIEAVLFDVRYAARTLSRTRGFVVVSVFTLAIAIAVGTSLVTAVNGFFFRPLPVPDGAHLLALFTSDYSARENRGGSSYRDLISFSQAASELAELAGETRVSFGVGSGDHLAVVPGALVSSGYFTALRAKAALGRYPTYANPEQPVVVLSHALWRREFASDPAIVGSQVSVNGQFFTVAAVAPAEFLGTLREVSDEFWIDATFAPLLLPREDVLAARGNRRFHLIGRLRSGASLGALRTRLAMTAARLQQEDPRSWTDTTGSARRVTVLPEPEARLQGVSQSDLLLVVGGVAALGLALLAVASTNLASMQMARAASRRREIATRLALGADRARLIRQLLGESALVAAPGAALGVLLAKAASVAAMRFRPSGLPNADFTVDWRAMLFVAIGLLVVLVIFGLLPALQSVGVDLLSDLKGGDSIGRGGVRVGRTRGGLIVAQVAMSVTLTAASSLVALALIRQANDSRVEPNRVLVAPVTLLPTAGDSARADAALRELLDSLRRVPGVEAVTAALYVPVPGTRTTVMGKTWEDATDAKREIDANAVRPDYFRVNGIPTMRGRDFEDRDLEATPRVALVSRAMAEHLWPGQDPIGRQLRIDGRPAPVEIVGVVGEMRDPSPSADVGNSGLLYLPFLPRAEERFVVHVRSAGPPSVIAGALTKALRGHESRLLAPEVLPIERYLERVVMPAKVAARAAALLAGLQLLLAVAGLTGLVAYVATLRGREIGIRSALGATRNDILALVTRSGIRLAAIGGAIGIAMSVAVGTVIGSTLPVSAAIELRAIGFAALGFALVAGVAMLLPARRALAVTPATMLRTE